MTDACKADPRKSRAEIGYFVRGTEPTEYCDVHVLVDYDQFSEAVAVPTCPHSDLIQVGLLNIYREFPTDIYVDDGQYTAQELPKDYDYSNLGYYMPYYQNILPEGFFVGQPRNSWKYYNLACIYHINNPVIQPDPDDEQNDLMISNEELLSIVLNGR
jgi:penicillin-binding protein 1A